VTQLFFTPFSPFRVQSRARNSSSESESATINDPLHGRRFRLLFLFRRLALLRCPFVGRSELPIEVIDATTQERQGRSSFSALTYSYDPNGNRATLRDPDGGRFNDCRDAADRIAWLENPWNERTSFTHDAAGRRTLKTLANGTRAFHIPGIFGNPWDVKPADRLTNGVRNSFRTIGQGGPA